LHPYPFSLQELTWYRLSRCVEMGVFSPNGFFLDNSEKGFSWMRRKLV
jgi:hypothetical protein